MTYDDGILTVYIVTNGAAPGDKPAYALTEKAKHYFCYDTLGITRYYTALQADQHIAAVVCVPDWPDIKVTDIVVLEDGTQFTVQMVQPGKDKNGLRMTQLSLERVKQDYALPGQS